MIMNGEKPYPIERRVMEDVCTVFDYVVVIFDCDRVGIQAENKNLLFKTMKPST